jgi:hypothetical protein
MQTPAGRALSQRQNASKKYGLNLAPTDSVPQEHSEAQDTPLAGKASTMGSVAQKTAWKTPEGAAYSAESRKSTLFDEDSPGVAKISRDQ